MREDRSGLVGPHQSFGEQLSPVLRGELERFGLLAAAFAECEVELCSLTFSHRADTTDVPIRPLVPWAEINTPLVTHTHTSSLT